MEQQQSRDDSASRAQAEEVARRELAEVQRKAGVVQEQVEKLTPERDGKVAEAERIATEQERAEAQLQQLYSKQGRASQFGSKRERDDHLKKEMGSLKAVVAKKEKQAETLRAELEANQGRAAEQGKAAEAAKAKLAQNRKAAEEARARCAELRTERDAKADARKELWKKEQELAQAVKANAEECEKAHRKLQHSMSRAQWDAVQAVKRITKDQRISGVHGMLVELLRCDDKYTTAIEQYAGNQLFQVVVDNDDVRGRMHARRTLPPPRPM
eukprot:4095935-Prymnesium_polylepis.1